MLEESDKVEDELFKMDDVKIEVMRARGAGGQVHPLPPSPSLFHLTN